MAGDAVRTPQNSVEWMLVVLLAAIIITAAVSIALFIRWAVMEADAKHDCRATGAMVIDGKSGEWHCARNLPEGKR